MFTVDLTEILPRLSRFDAVEVATKRYLTAEQAGIRFAIAEAMAFGHERDGLSRRRARWPWLVLLGIGVVWLIKVGR